MCGRFTLGATATDLATQFNLATVPTWTPRYNIAPTQEVLVVRQPSPQASREACLHRWGLLPSWANDPAIGTRLINARAAIWKKSRVAFTVAGGTRSSGSY